MIIKNFEKQHIEEANIIALTNYDKERQSVKELPIIHDIPDLYVYAENGLGVAAFDHGKMVGFLGCVSPFDNTFRSTDVKGVFSSMGANAAIGENRAQIYAAMYQAAGENG